MHDELERNKKEVFVSISVSCPEYLERLQSHILAQTRTRCVKNGSHKPEITMQLTLPPSI
jgi:hypothetical protein